MKSIRYTLCINLLLCFFCNETFACWGPWFTPGGYYMYRICDPENDSYNPTDRNRNCQEWQRLTSASISLNDIEEIVYTMPLQEFIQLAGTSEYTGHNTFARWIKTYDRDILQFLLLAKNNEEARLLRNSPWYYPTMKDDTPMSLEEIATQALARTSPRLRDRYLLQGVRALFTMKRYQECVNIWNSEAQKLPADNLMRKMMQPYIAGAEFQLKHTGKALKYFAETGDIQSLLYCTGQTGKQLSDTEAIRLIYEHCPNSPFIPRMLQKIIRKLEPDGNIFDTFCDNSTSANLQKQLYDLSLTIAQEGKSDNPAMWYYTAAFIAELRGQSYQASSALTLAEKAPGTPLVKESVRIMRIYLDAKLSTYNLAYENRLYEQLKWLDTLITSNINEDVIEETANLSDLKLCTSYYYYNDMLRRILLEVVCPRMIKAGKTTRALQLANMADNRLLQYINKVRIQTETTSLFCTLKDYRYSSTEFNWLDYSNYFFELIDRTGLTHAIAYYENINQPTTDFDKFLNERSYTDRNYLLDIIGTQCLRNMKYAEAEKYLGQIGIGFDAHLNVKLQQDPFSIADRTASDTVNFKYLFASEMHRLEQEIGQESDRNRKARLTMKYAIGLRNSVGRSWPLTQYYYGTSFYGQIYPEKYNWMNKRKRKEILKCSYKYIQKALHTATDRQLLAEIHYSLCNFKTLATHFADTEKGILVRGACDRLSDYHIESTRQIIW